nr:uncharacterized protein LOC111758120 [Cavia porcellus]
MAVGRHLSSFCIHDLVALSTHSPTPGHGPRGSPGMPAVPTACCRQPVFPEEEKRATERPQCDGGVNGTVRCGPRPLARTWASVPYLAAAEAKAQAGEFPWALTPGQAAPPPCSPPSSSGAPLPKAEHPKSSARLSAEAQTPTERSRGSRIAGPGGPQAPSATGDPGRRVPGTQPGSGSPPPRSPSPRDSAQVRPAVGPRPTLPAGHPAGLGQREKVQFPAPRNPRDAAPRQEGRGLDSAAFSGIRKTSKNRSEPEDTKPS